MTAARPPTPAGSWRLTIIASGLTMNSTSVPFGTVWSSGPASAVTVWRPAPATSTVNRCLVPAGHPRRQEVGVADERGDEGGGRPVVDLRRRADLLGPPGVHHRDPIGHGQRLGLVVGHVDERGVHLTLDALELHLHRLAQLEVQRAEGLVEQQCPRPVDERPGQGDPLLLPARQLAGAAVGHLGQAHQLQQLAHPPPYLGGADLP
ncbi:MAG: hypothetical protein R2749_03950 [Acidimicrobiales bacterium]